VGLAHASIDVGNGGTGLDEREDDRIVSKNFKEVNGGTF